MQRNGRRQVLPRHEIGSDRHPHRLPEPGSKPMQNGKNHQQPDIDQPEQRQDRQDGCDHHDAELHVPRQHQPVVTVGEPEWVSSHAITVRPIR